MQFAAAAPLLGSPAGEPVYRVVTAYKPAAQPGMPGPYPGQVVRVHSENSIDPGTEKVNRELVKQMLASGMKTLTGDARTEDAWARFISPKDVVGIKVNCSGAPQYSLQSRSGGGHRRESDCRRRAGQTDLRVRAF